MDGRVRLLAVSHEASQTGAPIVLAFLLDWLKKNSDVSVRTLLVEDGPLRARFEGAGEVSALTDRSGAELLGFIERGLLARGAGRLRRVPSALRYLPAFASIGRFDLVYLNSLTTLDVVPFLKQPTRVIAHIHEGPLTIASWRRTHAPKPRHLALVERWIAVSEETAEAIESLPGVARDTVVLHHPFIDVGAAQDRTVSADELGSLRISMGIPPDAQVVVGSGTIDRRKGPDLFVQLAMAVRTGRRDDERPVHFVWVGGDLTGLDWPHLEADLQRTGADHVLDRHVADPWPLFHLADVFALTSREDPFPLVCMEHAALGVPVVAYDSSGITHLLAEAGPLAADGIVPIWTSRPWRHECETFSRIRRGLTKPACSRRPRSPPGTTSRWAAERSPRSSACDLVASALTTAPRTIA
ncbi:MAG: glycosyltransferase [Actinobacteria bacterium]|nr:glycosyltransferase [Actinomycetota bacterium]